MADELATVLMFNTLLADAQELDGVALSDLTTAQRWQLLALLAASFGWVGPGKVVKLPAAIPVQPGPPADDQGEQPKKRKPRKRG